MRSHTNTDREIHDRQEFFEEHGVDEYYDIDPIKHRLFGYYREGAIFRRVPKMNGWVSPRLGIRFEHIEEIILYGADGKSFIDFETLHADHKRVEQVLNNIAEERDDVVKERDRVTVERDHVINERDRITVENARVKDERDRAAAEAEQARRLAAEADAKYQALVAALRSAGDRPRSTQAEWRMR